MIETEIRALPAGGRATPSVVATGVGLGVVAVGIVALTSPELVAVLAAPLVGAAVLAAIDQRTRRITTVHAALLAGVTVVACGIGIVVDRGAWDSMVAGAALWSTPLFLLAVAGGFGGGDFKYAVSLGALTGWVSFASAVTGLLMGILVAATAALTVAARQRTTKVQLPLGLPLFVGAVGAVALLAAVE